MEFFKIMKTRTPISLYYLFNISSRKEDLLITPQPNHQFIYRSSYLWNEFRKSESLKLTSSCSTVKNTLRRSLIKAQGKFGSDWCDNNFTEFWSTRWHMSKHFSKPLIHFSFNSSYACSFSHEITAHIILYLIIEPQSLYKHLSNGFSRISSFSARCMNVKLS